MNDHPKRGYAITELFTAAQIELAAKLINEHQHGEVRLNDVLVEKVVREALPEINRVTGQENNEKYFAYLLEYGIGQAGLTKNVPD